MKLPITVLFRQLVHMTFYTQTLDISPRLRLLDASLEFDAKGTILLRRVQRIHPVWTGWQRTSFSKISILALGIS
ncbi:hypothetical protein BS17DRAFT_785054 [Gyrodon lividus]|nr:hypothetical protein BS17DRAFT_785054 [Gyrodon lividus]